MFGGGHESGTRERGMIGVGEASLGNLGWLLVLENMGIGTLQGEEDNGPLNVGVVACNAIQCDKTHCSCIYMKT